MSGLMQSEQSIRPLMTPAWANNSRTHPEHPSRAAAWPALLSAAGQPSFDTKSFLAKVESGKTRCEIRQQIIFLQGDPADAIFYIDRGKSNYGFPPGKARKPSSPSSESAISSARSVLSVNRGAWRPLSPRRTVRSRASKNRAWSRSCEANRNFPRSSSRTC